MIVGPVKHSRPVLLGSVLLISTRNIYFSF
nr:MAG TPA: hypothetical protein [Caudoviricetes sp.]